MESNTSTPETIGAALDPKGAAEKEAQATAEAEAISKAAAELGRKGGKAAAEKRKEAEEAPEKAEEAPRKAKPIPDRGKGEDQAKEAQEAPQEAQEAKPEEGEESEAEEEIKNAGIRKRIERAARDAAEAKRALAAERRERELLAAQLEAMRRQPAGQQEQPQARPVPTDKPRQEDYESFDSYLDARDEWNKRQWEQERARHEHATRYAQTWQTGIDGFQRAIQSALKSEPDFMERVDPDLRELRTSAFLAQGERRTADHVIADEIVFAGAKAPALMLYLSEHPDEFQRLRTLRTPSDVRVELRVIARTIGQRTDATTGNPPGAKQPGPTPAQSKAAPPVKPVTGAPFVAASDPGPRPGEDFDAWISRTGKRAAAR